MRTRIVLVVLAVVGLTLWSPTASANSMAFSTLTQSNLGSGFAGPFGSMTINLTSSTMATITFTANAGFLFIDGGVGAVQVNAGSWTVSGITETQLPGFHPPAAGFPQSAGSGSLDGFGTFNQTFKNSDGYGSALKTLSFTLTDTSGTWASASSVLTTNGGTPLPGFYDGAHIAACNGGNCTLASGANVTGFAVENTLTSNTPPPVPEPATLFLFGTVLSAAALVGKRLLNA